jgi:hypothetical protein
MKRIKIMLTVLTVLAVVGGALAFNAHKYSAAGCYYSSTASHDGLGTPANYCNFNVADGYILGPPGGNNYATFAFKVEGLCPRTITCTQKFLSLEE